MNFSSLKIRKLVSQFSLKTHVGAILPKSKVAIRSNCNSVFTELDRRLAPFVEVVTGKIKNPNLEMFIIDSDIVEIPNISKWKRVVIQTHPLIDRYNRSVLCTVIKGNTVAVNEQSGTLLISNPKNRVVVMIGKEEAGLVKDARRFLRDVNIDELRLKGFATFHVAGVVVNDECILICGSAGSGKTNLMIDMLRIGGVNYLANDRVFAIVDKEAVMAIGAPEHILMRIGTLGRINKFRSYLPLAYREKPQEHLWTLSDTEKVSIQFKDLVEVFGCSLVPCAYVTSIILPQFRKKHTSVSLIPVSKKELQNELKDSYHESIEYPRQPWHNLFTLNFDLIRFNQRFVEFFISENITAYKLYYGENNSLRAAEIALTNTI